MKLYIAKKINIKYIKYQFLIKKHIQKIRIKPKIKN